MPKPHMHTNYTKYDKLSQIWEFISCRTIIDVTSAVLRLECSLDSLSIDSAHVIYVSEGYDVAV